MLKNKELSLFAIWLELNLLAFVVTSIPLFYLFFSTLSSVFSDAVLSPVRADVSNFLLYFIILVYTLVGILYTFIVFKNRGKVQYLGLVTFLINSIPAINLQYSIFMIFIFGTISYYHFLPSYLVGKQVYDNLPMFLVNRINAANLHGQTEYIKEIFDLVRLLPQMIIELLVVLFFLVPTIKRLKTNALQNVKLNKSTKAKCPGKK